MVGTEVNDVNVTALSSHRVGTQAIDADGITYIMV